MSHVVSKSGWQNLPISDLPIDRNPRLRVRASPSDADANRGGIPEPHATIHQGVCQRVPIAQQGSYEYVPCLRGLRSSVSRCLFRMSGTSVLPWEPGPSPAPEATLERGDPRENPRKLVVLMKQTCSLIVKRHKNANVRDAWPASAPMRCPSSSAIRSSSLTELITNGRDGTEFFEKTY